MYTLPDFSKTTTTTITSSADTIPELGLTFDDVLLIPQKSFINSRSDINIETEITPLRSISIPLIMSNMDTISGFKSLDCIMGMGGTGIVHRYMALEEQINIIKNLVNSLTAPGPPLKMKVPVIAAVGVKELTNERIIKLVGAGCDILSIDVAHGHHENVLKAIETIKKLDIYSVNDNYPIEVIAGNIVTYQAAYDLFYAGADTIRVGIGNGSICSTRKITGHGFPQLTAIQECAQAAFEHDKKLISDGGIKTSGDIVKALAAGADCVMSGNLFAGTDEVPGEIIVGPDGEYKVYRGTASSTAQKDFYGNEPSAAEGVSGLVPRKGPLFKIIEQLVGGIRSGLSYSGVTNIPELQDNAKWIRVTPIGNNEANTITPEK